MSDFTVNYSVSPWLLLLIIPIAALTLIPYFRMNKRYRRNRNRIISIALHLIITVLAVSVLAGVSFAYNIQNKENEIMLLVDCSDSLSISDNERNRAIEDIIYSSGSRFKIGIVAFGKDQVYAAQPSNDVEETYRKYIDSLAENPVDGRATDFASALLFTQDKFKNPETAKVVVISDGFETDGNAMSAIKTLTSLGIDVDAIKLDRYFDREIAITDVEIPNQSFKYGEKFDIHVTIQTTVDRPNIGLQIYENGELVNMDDMEDSMFKLTNNSIGKDAPFVYDIKNYMFERADDTEPGNDIRELSFKLVDLDEGAADGFADNNTYYTYVNVQNFNNILMIEGVEGDSAKLIETLTDTDNPFEIKSFNIKEIIPNDPEFPNTLEEMSEYDQIILVNVSYSDLLGENMPIEYDNELAREVTFEENLNRYAREVGGSVFVVGGTEAGSIAAGEPEAHAFNREDFETAKEGGFTAFADMLPVEVTPYRPPLGVMLVIDNSGSMGVGRDDNIMDKLDYACDAALRLIDNLDDHDYVGITCFSERPIEILPITQVIDARDRARELVDQIGESAGSGGTNISPALRSAGQALESISTIDRRHMIVITDGEPSEKLFGTAGVGHEAYGPIIESNYARCGTTMSLIHIASSSGFSNSSQMKTAAEVLGHGRYVKVVESNLSELLTIIDEELATQMLDEASDYNNGAEFTPVIDELTSIFNGIDTRNLPKVGGYLGAKLKPKTSSPLRAEFNAPLYAQWKYGRGKVGVFMCSLNGDKWSQDWVTSDSQGKKLINNIVEDLMPTQDITMSDIQITIDEDNFTTRVNLFTEVPENEYIQVDVYKQNGADVSIYSNMFMQENNRATFELEEPGTYRIEARKYNANGEEKEGTYVKKFRVFSYSKEYNIFESDKTATTFLTDLTASGNGELLNNGADVFLKYDTNIHKTFDPTITFLIIAIVLFLLDVAVRKFKFKWIHEIVRDRKERKRIIGEKR